MCIISQVEVLLLTFPTPPSSMKIMLTIILHVADYRMCSYDYTLPIITGHFYAPSMYICFIMYIERIMAILSAVAGGLFSFEVIGSLCMCIIIVLSPPGDLTKA